MVTVVQGKVCAKNHPDRLSRLATIHQRYDRQTDRQTDGRISYGIGLDLTVGQKLALKGPHFISFLSDKFVIEQTRVNYGKRPYWVSYDLVQTP